MFDVLIIGSGPSGMTCAIYAKRFNLNVGIIESECPGGEVVKNNAIQNYPGFSSIDGTDLAMKMFSQMTELGVEYLGGKVSKINKKAEQSFEVFLEDDTVYESKSVVIATGTRDRTLGLENEEKYFYNGISWCAVCDGPIYKDMEVAVVGGGLSAISSALTLARSSKKVHLIHRRDEFRGEKIDLDKLKELDNVIIHTNSQIVKMENKNNENKLDTLTIQNKNGDTKELNVECLFECIGKLPNNQFILNNSELDKIELDKEGFIIVDEDMQTSVKGLFACGDIISKKVRQIATAVNDGAIAGISANKYIN